MKHFKPGKAILLSAAGLFLAPLARTQPQAVDYARDVAPLLRERCGTCHGGGMSMGGLRLDSVASVLKGGKSGPAVVPGHSAQSLLMQRVQGTTDAPRMPMNGPPLSQAEIVLLGTWIDQSRFQALPPEHTTAEENSPRSGSSPVFATKIRPVLASRCYGCHGAGQQQAGLRLDSLAGILKGSDSGRIISPGQAANSRLIRRLTAQERPQMPYGGPPLTNEQVSDIRAWIEAGAPGPDSNERLAETKPLKHWSYVKPVQPALPGVQNGAWVRNPIDNFILSRLEGAGLGPSPEAEKPVLLRRVYLDLVGIPPTPKEVDEFLADRSPDAYERVVERLLASPHYGERWARQWLDLARYADTNGYEKDNRRTAWEYRDWVIRALNSDLSFRDFTIDQIAGDMLPNPTSDQRIATGFHRNTMLNQEGGVDPEEYYWYELVDRTNTTAAVWLGSTLGCAQCHNHKFDPFTQKDYYRFLAFFSNSKYEVTGKPSAQYAQEPELELPDAAQAVKAKEVRARIAALKETLDTETPELRAAQQAWERQLRAADGKWTVLTATALHSQGGAVLKVLDDGSVLASGKNPQADQYTFTAIAPPGQVSAFRLEVMADKSLPDAGPGRDAEGNFFLSAFDLQIAPAASPSKAKPVRWKFASADEAQSGYEVENLFNTGKGLKGWAIDASFNSRTPKREAVFVPAETLRFASPTLVTLTMKHEMRHAARNIGRFRIAVTDTAEPVFITEVPAHLRAVLAQPESERSPADREALARAYRKVSPLLNAEREQLAAEERSLQALGIATAMVLEEKSGTERPSAYVRERGSFTSKGEQVFANVPAVLGGLPSGAAPNRLTLARWLVSDDNPLTARVTVNHFWEAIFGHGLVETAEDFGTQGDAPSHPELLDWLATEFMRDGWSMKQIQRLIVTSATYRQSSRTTPELQARDPYNKLYGRGPRFRVEAETVHDIALSAGGLLSGKMYGPSVFPYQPEGIWDMPYSTDRWVESGGEDRYRRSLYTFVRRSAPYPSLATFDAPSREFCTVRRVRTNTPLQALTTLNDPFFFAAAQGLAKRMQEEGGSGNEERLRYGFRICVARAPKESELKSLLAFYGRQRDQFGRENADAAKVAPAGAKHLPEAAAWTMVANVLLNMDETVSKE